MEGISLKHDKYRKARGGYSRLLEVSCEHCDHLIAIYQKDGPGSLKRMYIDRIISPEYLTKLQYFPIKKVSGLACSNCKRLVGVPIIYQKEKRPAFRLFEGAVTKKIMKTG